MIFLEENKNYKFNNKNINFTLSKEENFQKGVDNYKLSAFVDDNLIGYITVSNYSDNYDYKANFLKNLFGTKNIKKILKRKRNEIECDIEQYDKNKHSFFLDCLSNLNLKTEKILSCYLKELYSSKCANDEYQNFLEETEKSNFVEYVFVNEDFRGQGISDILYEKMAKISIHNNKRLGSSIFQTEDGEKLWNRFLKQKTFPIEKKNNVYYITNELMLEKPKNNKKIKRMKV